CECASSDLEVSHTSVDFESELYKKIFDSHEFSRDNAALSTFITAFKTPCRAINPVTNEQCDGLPILKEYSYIRCNKWQSTQCNHRYITINSRVNRQYLEKLFCEYSYIDSQSIITDPIKDCYYVQPISGKTSLCPKIIQKPCNVKFYHFLPLNLVECPFIVIVSIGEHNHPPPPPVKTPSTIVQDLENIINYENSLELTGRKFLTRPMLKAYLNGVQK
ncbi:11972_t:CDS:2, partial [Racocetra persica]